MPDKLTDIEIKKALNQCACSETNCYGCPYWDASNCSDRLCMDALDLINRLQAEIERLQKENNEILKVAKHFKEEYEKVLNHYFIDTEIRGTGTPLQTAKAEAYKECIEKVKEKSCKLNMCHNNIVVKTDYQISGNALDNLSKELVGEDNV